MKKSWLCSTCVHIHPTKFDGAGNFLPATCEAFPTGIPMEICSRKVEHTEPYKGDNGILYERDKTLDGMSDAECVEFAMKQFEKNK